VVSLAALLSRVWDHRPCVCSTTLLTRTGAAASSLNGKGTDADLILVGGTMLSSPLSISCYVVSNLFLRFIFVLM
jgi:hypothetical protein